MHAFKFVLIAAVLSAGPALAQTVPATSTTSGPISGSGATTSGTAPASVGSPGQYSSQQYRTQMRKNRATSPRKHRQKLVHETRLTPNGEKTN